ncbi:hypothetical protein DUNSADRAFT_6252 [Dunaliella salina]|uniref:Encoded protein n=1 Tax=Dunaliella salina TaxID=3046 RepID=A0ABQ7GNS6_DUNSA|nr:hypothetical protein DUNSADRAFT_6252 [Dunaliella salina]|eukprot:KAF5836239.1 hypothetical protein DUNSADRAFT_6252 [Dunaliella salina]
MQGEGSKRRRYEEYQKQFAGEGSRTEAAPSRPAGGGIEKGMIAALKSRMANAEGASRGSEKEREEVAKLEKEKEQMQKMVPEERVAKLVTKLCRRTMLAQRFQLYMESQRLLRNRHGPGMFGMGHSRTNLVVPGAVDLTVSLHNLDGHIDLVK